ncbi:hypothetical protein F2Q69_00019999 [Brassica cretica]|uniref:Uncharacterized protein n=1 Tax=Brassica cretica TaxID=69181 RepID=A0A8S9Q4W5_BRACR|nr:hypothetical protein F2Q69_00019999 [Brassica cretica]
MDDPHQGLDMKGQPASQQSNKNMTDRPTQHHGLEALHDGLTGNPAKQKDANSTPAGLNPRDFYRLTLSTGHLKTTTSEEVQQPSTLYLGPFVNLVFLLYPWQYPISLPQRPEEGTFNRTRPTVQSGHRATAPVQSGHCRLLHDDRGLQYGRVTTRQPQYSRVTAGHYPVRVTTQPWAMTPVSLSVLDPANKGFP